MDEFLISLEDMRRRDFRRLLGTSAGLHLLLALFFTWAPKPDYPTLPAVVSVNLVTMAPAPAAPAPAKPAPAKPAPEPAPPPPPKPPPEKRVVIPEKPISKPEPAPKERKPEPAPEPEQVDYEDLLANLRAEAGEPEPQAQPEPAATAALPGGGPGIQVSPEEFTWRRSAKMHVTRAWVLAPGFRMQPLEAEVMVRLGPGGEVIGTRISRSSGNPWYDESVERAVQKASPLPAPPDADEWPFRFTPGDLR